MKKLVLLGLVGSFMFASNFANLVNRKVTIPKGTYVKTTKSDMKAAIIIYKQHGGTEKAWETLNLIGGTYTKGMLFGVIKNCDEVKHVIFCKVNIGSQNIFVRKKDLDIGAKMVY